MSDVNQITPEDLVQLRTLQESYSEITAKFGQLKVEQILLKGQLERLAELEKSADGKLKTVYDKYEGKYSYTCIQIVRLFVG